MQITDLNKIISEFEEREFPRKEEQISGILIDYIIAFENELISRKDLAPYQDKIKQALLSLK